MKVKEVINKCEDLLEVSSTKEELLAAFNRVEQELALDYLPLYTTHLCNATIVHYDEFEYEPVRVVECNCRFKLYPTYIEAKETITEVQYAYLPHKKELYDECSYGENVLDCLVYGVISEYLTSQGFYEEGYAWQCKYKKAISILIL